jgi:hypothetical protein
LQRFSIKITVKKNNIIFAFQRGIKEAAIFQPPPQVVLQTGFLLSGPLMTVLGNQYTRIAWP